MHVTVNGARLFFDVEGAKLVADGPQLVERPTIILLHGGPGADHAIHKPAWSRLADYAQVIYLDHRGNGRSDDGQSAGNVVGSCCAVCVVLLRHRSSFIHQPLPEYECHRRCR